MAGKQMNDITWAKFRAFYDFFDVYEEENLNETRIMGFHKLVLSYTEWSPTSTESCCLHECLEEAIWMGQDQGEGISFKLPVTPDMFITSLHRQLEDCKGFQHLPLWLQIFPKLLFEIIDRNGDGRIDMVELSCFYGSFFNHKVSKHNLMTAYSSMTEKNHFSIDLTLTEQLFCNFLLSKNSAGPGKYLFACFNLPTTDITASLKVKKEQPDTKPSTSKMSPGPTVKLPWSNDYESRV